MERLLIVDDEQSMREWLTIALSQDGFEVESAASGEEALKALERIPVDLALVDLRMPGMDGLATLRRIKEVNEAVSVVIMTAYATAETAVQALKEGAYDYLIKPFKVDELRHLVHKALEERRLRAENVRLRREIEPRYQFPGNLIGESSKMRQVFATAARLGDSKATVLITGESGTGKEVVAKAIHFNSYRKLRPFVTVNCGAIPADLMESELFGHVKGAFTGAVSAKQGLFEVADGGTLFLDEVAELPPLLQVKLLRVLEDPEIRPVGGIKPVRVDVRIIAATNRNLAQALERGAFREDLYYRLNVISLHLPALRERREEIPLFVGHFLAKSVAAGALRKQVSAEALAALERYPWPGNVRELENVIERAVTLEPGPAIGVESLPEHVRGGFAPDFPRVELPSEGLDLDAVMERMERDLLGQALRRAEGVQTRAAQLLGTSFRSFRYRLQKYGLDRE